MHAIKLPLRASNYNEVPVFDVDKDVLELCLYELRPSWQRGLDSEPSQNNCFPFHYICTERKERNYRNDIILACAVLLMFLNLASS